MYTDDMSVKFQITVPEALMAQWKQAAEAAGISVAELIRQMMTDRLRPNGRRTRTDPFEAITGLVNSEDVDFASKVDEVLYG